MNNFYKKSKIIYIFALLAFALSVPSTYLEAQSADKPKTQTKYKKARALQTKLQKKWLKFMKLLKW